MDVVVVSSRRAQLDGDELGAVGRDDPQARIVAEGEDDGVDEDDDDASCDR